MLVVEPFFFSMCEWGEEFPCLWAPKVGNSWRTTGDINDSWKRMLHNWDFNGVPECAGPGGWNDPDMLEVGNGGMTTTEYISHFSLWSMGKAPLIIGCDMSTMSNDTKMILMNKEVIAINQDPLGNQCALKYFTLEQQVYGAHLVNNEYAVLFLNRADTVANITITWEKLNLTPSQGYVLRDLWLHDNITSYATEQWTSEVQSHGVVLLRMYPVSQ